MKIVSLLASATEIVCGLGAADELVAISHECDFPTEILGRPRITKAWIDDQLPSAEIDAQVRERLSKGLPLYTIDESALARLAPDLIITQSQCEVCAVSYQDVAQTAARLSRPPQVVDLNPTSLSEVLADIQRIGSALGRQSRAQAYVEDLRERLQDMETRLAGATRPSVACIEWTEPLMFAANWTPELFRRAGGEYVLGEDGEHSRYGQWESLRTANPDIIVVSPCGFDLERTRREFASLRAHPDWNSLSAAREGEVYAVDGNVYLNRSGPRLVDTIEVLARILHADRCTDLEVADKAWCRLQ